MKRLLSAGSNALAINNFGRSTLSIAAGNIDVTPRVLRFLIRHIEKKHGPCELAAAINEQASQTRGWRATMAIRLAKLLHGSRLPLRLSSIVKHAVFTHRSTALHQAIREGNLECIKCLLENGADPTIQNHTGMDALDVLRVHRSGLLDRVRKIIETQAAKRGRPQQDTTSDSGKRDRASEHTRSGQSSATNSEASASSSPRSTSRRLTSFWTKLPAEIRDYWPLSTAIEDVSDDDTSDGEKNFPYTPGVLGSGLRRTSHRGPSPSMTRGPGAMKEFALSDESSMLYGIENRKDDENIADAA